MKVRYGKWILSKPAQIIDLLAKKDQQIADAEAARSLLADYVDSVLAQHQPYWGKGHRDGFDLSTAPHSELASRLHAQLGKDLWCAHCSARWPCSSVEPLRAIERNLRYPGRYEVPELFVTRRSGWP